MKKIKSLLLISLIILLISSCVIISVKNKTGRRSRVLRDTTIDYVNQTVKTREIKTN